MSSGADHFDYGRVLRVRAEYSAAYAEWHVILTSEMHGISTIFRLESHDFPSARTFSLYTDGLAYHLRSDLLTRREIERYIVDYREQLRRSRREPFENRPVANYSQISVQAHGMRTSPNPRIRAAVENHANARSNSLQTLMKFLTPEQRHSFYTRSRFETIGQDGHTYTILASRVYNVYDNHTADIYCGTPAGDLPIGDCILLSKISVESNLEEFKRRANHQVYVNYLEVTPEVEFSQTRY